MGLFDPPYKKILAKAPPPFVILMQQFDPQFVAALREGGVPENGYDLSRNLIYSIVIPRLDARYGVFSADALRYAQITGANAFRVYPKRFVPLINQMVHALLTVIEREAGEPLTMSE